MTTPTDDGNLPSHEPKRRKLNATQTASHDQSAQRFAVDDYTVGWICALPIETAAARAMLDEIHAIDKAGGHGDTNLYTLGRIERHFVVIACLPDYGTNNAATVANNMGRSFQSLRVRLLVGIGGGVPTLKDVRLGDVVVGTEVVQYDMGKDIGANDFQITGQRVKAAPEYLNAIGSLRAAHESRPNRILSAIGEMVERNPTMAHFARSTALQDQLFDRDYRHDNGSEDCAGCSPSRLIRRSGRRHDEPMVHYGLVASGNRVMRSSVARDDWASKLDNLLCFEMEAAGLVGNFPCLVIRGICDYSDSHKNKSWQKYAAATAASYARELLSVIPPVSVFNAGRQDQAFSDEAIVSEAASRDHVTERREAMLDSLWFDRLDSRLNNIKEAHRTTCAWFLTHPTYLSWLSPQDLAHHHGFIWIRGKPGTGKSTLMKYIFAHARGGATEDHATLSFFFNARGHDLERTTIGMYRSLVHQLMTTFPDLQEVLDTGPQSLSNMHDTLSHEQNDAWLVAVRELFTRAISRLGTRRLTLFIDALDECHEDQIREMLDHFEELGVNSLATGGNLWICFSSRHYPTIDIEHGHKLVLEDQPDHDEDLAKYIRSKLGSKRGKLIDRIRAQVLHKAAGVFMWAVLVIPMLKKVIDNGRIFEVEHRLEEIPTELSELFRDIVRRDRENLSDLVLCLQWILFSRRPLKGSELYFAVSLGNSSSDDKGCEFTAEDVDAEYFDSFVTSSSKGLAEVARSKDKAVQFIHESVRDFLLKDGGLRELTVDLGSSVESSSHDSLKDACLKQVRLGIYQHFGDTDRRSKASSTEAKELRRSISSKFPFMNYAVRQLFYHADQAAVHISQDAFLGDITMPDWIGLHNIFEIYETRCYKPSTNSLYIFSELGYARLVTAALDKCPDMERDCGRYKHPLFAAIATGNMDAASAILRGEVNTGDLETFAADFKSNILQLKRWPSPLQRAFRMGQKSVALALAKTVASSDVESRDSTGVSLLSHAASCGHLQLVCWLLDAGALLESTDNCGRTPLLFAAWNMRMSVVKELLSRGAYRWAADRDGNTTLSLTLHESAAAQVFLDSGACGPVLDSSEEGPKPASQVDTDAVRRFMGQIRGVSSEKFHARLFRLVQAAGEIERLDLVEMFLEAMHQTDEQPYDHSYGDALGLAIRRGNVEWSRLLLDHGANVERLWDTSGRPLGLAARLGHEAIVQELIGRGANLEASGESGMTPLLWAVAENHDAVVQHLLEAGANIAARTIPEGLSPLSLAVLHGHLAAIKRLIAKRADLESRTTRGQTPLMLAAWGDHKVTLERLLRSGADLEARDNEGKTALFLAIKSRCDRIARKLLAWGANPNSTTQEGLSPLHEAAGLSPDFTRYRHKCGAAFLAGCPHGGSPFFSSVRPPANEDAVGLLLSAGVDIERKNDHGETPLIFAVRARNRESVAILLERGADVEVCARGETPLVIAAGSLGAPGSRSIFRLLLRYGADVTALDRLPAIDPRRMSRDEIERYVGQSRVRGSR